MKSLGEWARGMGVSDMLDPDEVSEQAVRACTFASAFVDFEGLSDADGIPVVTDADIDITLLFIVQPNLQYNPICSTTQFAVQPNLQYNPSCSTAQPRIRASYHRYRGYFFVFWYC